MNKNEFEVLRDYMFRGQTGNILIGHKFNTYGKPFLSFLNSYFETDISQTMFDEVTEGEGGEQNKIDTFYSSSLQSLLFFANVSDSNRITVERTSYNKVRFEFENRVIGYPSSVDVVLINEADGVAKDILFIESKFLEPVRDSRKADDSANSVVGRSYFENKKSGYKAKLNISNDELAVLGFDTATEIKGKFAINPIKENKYVYAYGIKQMFSHLIGIVNFMQEENRRIKTADNVNIRFMTLYNSLPNIGNEKILNAEKKLHDFESHYNAAAEVLDNKLPGIKVLPLMSYQKLYKQICQDYPLSEPIVEFYHLLD